jgi:hypothetical protein
MARSTPLTMTRGLAYQGYHVDVAHSGVQGLEQAWR